MIVDTHAHLDMKAFHDDLPEVIKSAAQAGVGRIISIGVDMESSRAAIDLADRFSPVWAAVGIHPNEAAAWNENSRSLLMKMLKHPKVAAVGETGLDFYRRHAISSRQIASFKGHLDMALKAEMPVIIHSREANSVVLKILKETGRTVNGVMHCFSGTLEEAREFLALGMKISLGGPLTFPKAIGSRTLVSSLPAESFMLETDCPYLAPQSHRGKRNEPALIVEVLEKMAELKGLGIEDIARITTANARELFGLGLEENIGEIAYRIRNSIYLNITNRCSNRCTFCGRQSNYRVKGHDLHLEREPDIQEIVRAIEQHKDFYEVVFCGYGEPLLRIDTVKEVSRLMKAAGHRVRINTNGLASLVHGRSIPNELKGLVDSYSISLNAPDAGTYEKICRPEPGPEPFEAILTFIREAVGTDSEVTATAVNLPGMDIEACRRLALSCGARFRVRTHNDIG